MPDAEEDVEVATETSEEDKVALEVTENEKAKETMISVDKI